MSSINDISIDELGYDSSSNKRFELISIMKDFTTKVDTYGRIQSNLVVG